MVVFTLSVLDWEYPFWAKLVQKLKIVSDFLLYFKNIRRSNTNPCSTHPFTMRNIDHLKQLFDFNFLKSLAKGPLFVFYTIFTEFVYYSVVPPYLTKMLLK